MSKILITGITGQDGSYMAEYCLNMGHDVYGLVRRTSQIHDKNYRHLVGNDNFHVVYGDITDGTSINTTVKEIQPNYFINFAAQSFVGVSWKIPEETFMAGAVGVLKCLEAVRQYAPACRFYNAGSSEQFGDVLYSPQNEQHPFRPRSPYGAAKAAANHLVKVYRESYNIYAVQGLLFNHESERRGEEFVTRKITKGVARIKRAILYGDSFQPIELGNLDAKRDWSHAEDFVDGVWRMLNQEQYQPKLKEFCYKQGNLLLPFSVEKKNCEILSKHVKEYVLSSGETHSIREFVERAFHHAGLNGHWVVAINTAADKDTPLDFLPEEFILDDVKFELDLSKMAITSTKGSCLVRINPKFYRPAEVELLLGDSTLARKELAWEPKISFDNLVKRMVQYDLNG